MSTRHTAWVWVVALALGCATTPPAPSQNASAGRRLGLRAEYAKALVLADIDEREIRCNGRQIWSDTIMPDTQAGVAGLLDIVARHQGDAMPPSGSEERAQLEHEIRDLIMWRLIRTTLLGGKFNNFGALPVKGLTTAAGRPVILFRAGITPSPAAPRSCFRSLVEGGGTRHALNLYSGEMPTQDLDDAERKTIEEAGGTYHLGRLDKSGGNWRSMMRSDPAKTGEAMKIVGRLINERVLRPNGERPQGNILVHCGGGMHRTGMVVGVIQRCINGADSQLVEAQYKHHTAWQSPDRLGGFEQENLDFIQTFDCSLLNTP